MQIDFEDAVIEANIRCLLAAVLEHRGVVSECEPILPRQPFNVLP